METLAKSETNKCSVCSKDANLVCEDCKGTPDGRGGLTAVYYCNVTCQKQDWNAHKSACEACKDRQAVHRAGHIAQRLNYTFRRNTWLWAIKRAERIRLGTTGIAWQLFDGEHPENDMGYFLPFPNDMFPDLKDQEAILSHGGCRDAIADMGTLVKDLLEDIYSEIREVVIRVKNTPMKIVRLQGHVPIRPICFRSHEVLQVTLNSKEVYVFDMTAAQYGWHESATMPWHTFEEEKVESIKKVGTFGETADALRVEGASMSWRHQHYMETTKQWFYMFLTEWQRQNIPLKAMLRCSEAKFKSNRDSLLRIMDKSMFAMHCELNQDFKNSMMAREVSPLALG